MPARSVAYGTRLSVVCFTLGGLTAAAQSPGQPDCPRGTLPAYAHNDYINTRPLHDALSLGYKGVEADVFLVEGVLRLGHGYGVFGSDTGGVTSNPIHTVYRRSEMGGGN